jgi:hypothetical protein
MSMGRLFDLLAIVDALEPEDHAPDCPQDIEGTQPDPQHCLACLAEGLAVEIAALRVRLGMAGVVMPENMEEALAWGTGFEANGVGR